MAKNQKYGETSAKTIKQAEESAGVRTIIDRQISICPISPFPSNKYILWISESDAFCVRLIPFRICLCYHTIVTHEKRKRQEPPTKVCFLPFMNTAAIHKDEDHQ